MYRQFDGEKVINQHKDINCPECGKNPIITINDYKITLNKCDNGHNIQNIFLDKFQEMQKDNEYKVYCCNCHKNKAELFNYDFYKCLNCNNFFMLKMYI